MNLSSLANKFTIFIDLFFNGGGWKRVLFEGLRNTLLIAILGLLIGILVGTVIAIIRVMPKYKRLPRVLDRFCTVYVGFFRGTPIVVQLLIAYYVLFPLLGISITSLAIRKQFISLTIPLMIYMIYSFVFARAMIMC